MPKNYNFYNFYKNQKIRKILKIQKIQKISKSQKDFKKNKKIEIFYFFFNNKMSKYIEDENILELRQLLEEANLKALKIEEEANLKALKIEEEANLKIRKIEEASNLEALKNKKEANEIKKKYKQLEFKYEAVTEEKDLLKEENETIKEGYEKLEIQQKISNEGKIFLSAIFNGLPEIKFDKFNKSTSQMKNPNLVTTSNRKEIKKMIISHFKIKKHLNINEERLDLIDSKFFSKNNIYTKKFVHFSSENSIQRLINDYMTDIFDIMQRLNYLACYDTTSIITAISKEEMEKHNIPDVTIVKTRELNPVLPIEIKIPPEGDVDILNNKKVIGQLYDYMLSIKSFYNKKKVFGILTTLKGWRFLWLPNEEEIDLKDRTVYITETYDISHPDLAKIIISVIIRALESEFYSVKIFDSLRNYIEYSSRGCRWKRISEDHIEDLEDNINFNIYNDCSSEDVLTYTIFKFFQTGPQTQTSLIINENGSIGVLKQFYEKTNIDNEENLEGYKNFENESSLWGEIYNIKTCIKTINGNPSFIMPLIFTFETKFNKKTDKTDVFLQTDLRKIFTYEGAISAELPSSLNKFTCYIDKYTNDIDIINIAEKAIKKFSKKGYLHTDLKWDHIGLLPVLGTKGNIIKMKPVLIDLQYVEECNPKEAKRIMLERLERMKGGDYNIIN